MKWNNEYNSSDFGDLGKVEKLAGVSFPERLFDSYWYVQNRSDFPFPFKNV